MTCERYWTDGVALLERGEPDPHREGCAACRGEHRARERIVGALPRIAAGRGDPAWQDRVWGRITSQARAAGARSRRPARARRSRA